MSDGSSTRNDAFLCSRVWRRRRPHRHLRRAGELSPCDRVWRFNDGAMRRWKRRWGMTFHERQRGLARRFAQQLHACLDASATRCAGDSPCRVPSGRGSRLRTSGASRAPIHLPSDHDLCPRPIRVGRRAARHDRSTSPFLTWQDSGDPWCPMVMSRRQTRCVVV